MTVRALQALVVMSLFGALANEVVGVGAAMVLALLVLPVAIASLTLGVVSRGDNSDKALQYALAAAFIAPLLALPGTLLGLTATILALAAAAVVGCGMKRWLSPASPVSRPELLGLSL